MRNHPSVSPGMVKFRYNGVMRNVALRIITLLVLCAIAGGCSGGSKNSVNMRRSEHLTTPGTIQSLNSQASITQDELHRALMLEFDRLGIDPAKVAAKAPTLSENRVFDLTARVVDADGTGPELPTGISLSWTEQLVGDYDQNGEVNINDIAGIGHHWRKMVEYDEAALHGGFKNWPTGDPDADGAVNWLRARVDGDHNSEININDLTPISLHWRERLDGYRLYVKAPGETGYTQGAPITPTRTTSAPVRITTEQAIGGQGVYSLYVAPYDSQTETEGPASNVITVDTESGIINQAPVADLRVTPDYAGAPAVITLDASGSYDLDGTIAVYHWDFDADGTVDWVSSDPVPDESSGGTVIEIEPQATEGVVTATYLQGSAEYYHPTVQVVDNEAAASEKADAELGLSGWESRILNLSLEDYELLVEPENAGIDPKTGEVLVFGRRMDTMVPFDNPLEEGRQYMARQVSEGNWEYELIDIPLEINGNPQQAYIRKVFWDEFYEPVVIYSLTTLLPVEFQSRVWSAQRQSSGNWIVEERYFSSYPDSTRGSSINIGTSLAHGSYLSLLQDSPTDKQSIYGTAWHRRYSILTYDHGNWGLEYTGYDTAERGELCVLPVVKPDGETHVIFSAEGDGLPASFSWALWEPGVGLGEPVAVLPEGESITFHYPDSGFYMEDGTLALSYCPTATQPVPNYIALISENGTVTTYQGATDADSNNRPHIYGLYQKENCVCCFITYRPEYLDKGFVTDHYQLVDGEWFVERLIDPRINPLLHTSGYSSSAYADSGELYAFVANLNIFLPDEPEKVVFEKGQYSICKHVDPREGEGSV